MDIVITIVAVLIFLLVFAIIAREIGVWFRVNTENVEREKVDSKPSNIILNIALGGFVLYILLGMMKSCLDH